MPRYDGTGPAGMGPMTGWGTGYCSGMRQGRFAGTGLGRGFGRGLGRGRGRGFGFAPYGYSHLGPASKEDEMEFLKQRAESLEAELVETRKVLKEFESDQSK